MALRFLSKILKKKEERPVIRKISPETPVKKITEEGKTEAALASEKIDRTDKPKKEIITGVLVASHVTEKASAAAGNGNKYTFVVRDRANKVDIKRAVEARYGVNVVRVNVVNVPGKERRRGRQVGWKPGYKKAIIALKKGERIEVQ